MKKIIIKNMVCPRCIQSVQQTLDQMHIPVSAIGLGFAEISVPLNELQKEDLFQALKTNGFELLDDKKAKLINEIKSIIIQQIHYDKEESPYGISDILAEKLQYDYSYLSRLFSSIEGRTIEQYTIAHKIEYVKELLMYDELTLSEIAFKLAYSSPSHLSNQFKKLTGMTPSTFKNLRKSDRSSLDDL